MWWRVNMNKKKSERWCEINVQLKARKESSVSEFRHRHLCRSAWVTRTLTHLNKDGRREEEKERGE